MGESVIIGVIAIYFLAGAIKGTLGIGFPTAAIALTATMLDARTAIAYVVIPMCLINAWQIYRSGHLLTVLKNHWRLVSTMVVSIAFFSLQSAGISIRWLTLLLGVVTSVFAMLSLWRTTPVLPDRYDNIGQIITGVIAGFIGGLAGIWAAPIIVYLTSRRVSSTVFVQVAGVLLFIGSFILLLGYTSTGIINRDNAFISTLLILPAVAGFSLGEKLRNRLSTDRFYNLVLIFFLILGLNFVRRALLM